MKILFVANDTSLFGSNRSMLNLIEELKKYGHNINVIIPKKGEIEQELLKMHINYKIFRYYSWIYPMNEHNFVKHFIKTLITLFSVIPMSRWIKKNKIEIIHSINSAVYIGSIVAAITKVKHIWHIRELVEEDHNYKFYNKKMAIKQFNKANAIIYISKIVENKYNSLVKAQSFLIYNGIPMVEYKNTENSEKNIDKYTILMAGNLSKTKGQEEAIKAIENLVNKKIYNVKLLLAGKGDYESELKEYVDTNKLNDYVNFLGFINNLENIRKDTNIALVCSQNEAFGRVTVEAMNYKNLVIGANTGGTIEIIKDGENGLLYKQGDYLDLSKKIEYAINNWDSMEKIIDVAYKDVITKFSIERCAKEVNDVYNKMKS